MTFHFVFVAQKLVGMPVEDVEQQVMRLRNDLLPPS
jgi:hypothetical protein